ncbi:sensor histidine kinase [Amycolatopsis nigrescens]|uniref:sensor histidine kinase n=1 Tax=Amycolatopsis nigrescens TaxID=381445 RepID=UPI0004783082|nr:histidine kinase [Amycolatopsis nigrescens]
MGRRSSRDWAVDSAMFLLAAVFGLFLAYIRVRSSALPDPAWLFQADQVTGVLGCAALWLRRRWPVALAVALIAASCYAELVAGAMLAALFTVAVHRPAKIALAVFSLSLLSATGYNLLRPEPDAPPELILAFGITLQAAAVGWGLFVQHRRRLVESLRERAARAETEANLRAEQAQLHAREAIAREMHDVLGHRLSLLSVHAGALEYRPDAAPEDVARAAKVIRESSHQALQDLREVIGVLRAPDGELPQPTLADLAQLVAESGRAGMRVELHEEVGGRVPETVGRTAYRIVQEGLTNARKHSPGSTVDVRVSGSAADGLTAEVRNTSTTTPPEAGAPGRGLAGLAERVALAGGRLEYGPATTDGWRLKAWLPWPP